MQPTKLTWSWSRHLQLGACLRRYAYLTYGSDEAKANPTDRWLREVAIQRGLDSVGQYLGKLAHELVAWSILEAQAGRAVDTSKVVERTRIRVRRDVEDSRSGRYRFAMGKAVGFSAHYYTEPLDLEQVEDDGVERVVGLVEHPVARRLREVPERIVEVERMHRVELEGVPMVLSPDVVVRGDDGGLVVIDWKTGRVPDDERLQGQLGLYGAWVADRYAATVVLMAAFHKGGQRTWRPHRSALRLHSESLVGSYAEMLRLNDRYTSLQEFPMTDDRQRCASCVFRASCDR